MKIANFIFNFLLNYQQHMENHVSNFQVFNQEIKCYQQKSKKKQKNSDVYNFKTVRIV